MISLASRSIDEILQVGLTCARSILSRGAASGFKVGKFLSN